MQTPLRQCLPLNVFQLKVKQSQNGSLVADNQFKIHCHLPSCGGNVTFNLLVRKFKYRTRAIISRGLYFFYPFFTAAAAYTADNLCTVGFLESVHFFWDFEPISQV